MGKELTIVALAAVFIFGIWYFNKEGCKGDGSNGLTGEDATLCWSGESLSEMFGGEASEDVDAAGPGGVTLIDPSGGGSTEEVQRMAEAQYKLRGTADRDPATGKPTPISPASRYGLAQAFASYVNNQITVA